jgi:RecA/RadA recombinase
MAKRKKKKKKGPEDPNAFMNSMIAAAEKKFGKAHMYVSDEHTQRFVGLPLPSLALEFMLRSNVLYLGSVYGLAGPPGSFKSSLGLEFARIICSADGRGSLTETEGGKISPDLITSILGPHAKHLLMKLVPNVEDAQSFLTLMIEWFQGQYPDKDKLYGLFLDSLYGSAGKEKHKKIVKEGHAGRSFPLEALLWSQWLQTFAPKLVGWPMVMVFVNHQKQDVDSTYKGSYRHPGGDAQEFYSTVYMHVKKLGVNEGVGQRISHLQLKTVKHSFAPEGRGIDVTFVMDKTAEPPRLFFDWGHATAALLTNKKKCPNIDDIIHITSTTESMTALTKTFSCKQLGLTAVPGSVLGAAIHQNAELMVELRQALDVRVHDIWDGYMEPVISEEAQQAEGQYDEDTEPKDAGDSLDL